MLEVAVKGFIYLSIAYHAVKWCWRMWIFHKAKDPESEFADLPIPPGDFGLPVIGETYLWALQGSRFNSSRRKKYGKAFSTNFLGRTMVKVTGPEYVKTLNNWDCSNVVMWNRTREFAFSTAQEALIGLPTASEDERQLMYETFNKMVENLFSLPFKYPGSAFCKGLEAREVLHKMLSKHLSEKRIQQEEDYVYLKDTNAIKSPERTGMVTGLQLMMDTENEIKLKNEIKGENVEPSDFSDLALIEGVVEIIFAGYLTTASSATSLVKNLIDHPDVFQKLEEELKENGLINSTPKPCRKNGEYLNNNFPISTVEEVLEKVELKRCNECNIIPSSISNETQTTAFTAVTNANNKNENNIIQTPYAMDIDKLNNLKYLNQVVRETMRYTPPILGTYRKTLKTIQLGKYRIPKDWTIVINIRDTHESEWDDVKTFDPDNFSEDKWKDSKENRYRYLPFGGGDRLCIGKEFARIQLKLLIIELVNRYKSWEFVNGEAPKMYAIPMLHPRNGMPVKLTPR